MILLALERRRPRTNDDTREQYDVNVSRFASWLYIGLYCSSMHFPCELCDVIDESGVAAVDMFMTLNAQQKFGFNLVRATYICVLHKPTNHPSWGGSMQAWVVCGWDGEWSCFRRSPKLYEVLTSVCNFSRKVCLNGMCIK